VEEDLGERPLYGSEVVDALIVGTCMGATGNTLLNAIMCFRREEALISGDTQAARLFGRMILSGPNHHQVLLEGMFARRMVEFARKGDLEGARLFGSVLDRPGIDR